MDPTKPTHMEQRVKRLEEDLASLEEHVQHIAATLVAIVEGARQREVIEVTPVIPSSIVAD